MKSDREHLNAIAQSTDFLRELSEEESKALKHALLSMYNDIAKLCDTHNLVYMLGGGSCLGAIRHQGYIPWDDDLDLMMPRADYTKLIELCASGALGEDYEVNYPSRTEDTKNLFLKIYKKGTLNLELHCENTPFPNGVYIDVFPMDSVPISPLLQKVKGIISFILQVISVSVLYAEYPSMKYQQYMCSSKLSTRRYRYRMFLGKVFGVISHRRWAYWFDRFNASSKLTGLTTIPTGRKHYWGEIMSDDVFYPVTKATFEGVQANIPNKYDLYLKNLYGDYMQLPPETKRERHFVYKFQCPLPDTDK